jgi:hypothetical protein
VEGVGRPTAADARKAGIRPDTFIKSWYQVNTFIFPSKIKVLRKYTD